MAGRSDPQRNAPLAFLRNSGLNSPFPCECLLVAQGLDRVEARGTAGGIDSRGQADE